MRILYVGFKGKNNTSFQLVSALDGERLFLTNSFSGIERDIEAQPGSQFGQHWKGFYPDRT